MIINGWSLPPPRPDDPLKRQPWYALQDGDRYRWLPPPPPPDGPGDSRSTRHRMVAIIAGCRRDRHRMIG
ncbi:hypothetical protein [Klebsiella aerogenes]|uniref:hypothetical protein n=1 Tax=Klebsiella aerogenes TaxID=548 RepID=UPI0028A2EBD2|nr:hypothetical protein [Klebsiella aerogenes]MDT4324935.1 hypothetical protein [Klebsiella aerogenes]